MHAVSFEFVSCEGHKNRGGGRGLLTRVSLPPREHLQEGPQDLSVAGPGKEGPPPPGLSSLKSLGLHPGRVQLTTLPQASREKQGSTPMPHRGLPPRGRRQKHLLKADTRQFHCRRTTSRNTEKGPGARVYRASLDQRTPSPDYSPAPSNKPRCRWVRSKSMGRALCGAGWQGKQRVKPRPREAPWHPAQTPAQGNSSPLLKECEACGTRRVMITTANPSPTSD